MIEKPPASSSRNYLENSFSPDIFGEFQVDNHQFLIVSLDGYQRAPTNISPTSERQTGYSEVGRFMVNGQLCAIVKVNSASLEEGVNIATLLTERELQIATLIALGRPNKQVASQLHISEWTVSTHLRRIFVKLGVDSRAAMVYRCASLIQRLQDIETVNS